MIRLTHIVAALGLVLAVAAPGAAQDSLAKRVSLDLKAMAPADAFKVIADAVGLTVDVANDVTTPVDIVVRNLTAKTALSTICESIGCTWKLAGTVITVRGGPGFAPAIKRDVKVKAEVQPAKKVSVSRVGADRLQVRFNQKLLGSVVFKKAPLTEVAERLSKAAGLEIKITVDPPAGQTFSADLSDRPLWSALKELSEQIKGNIVCRVTLPQEGGGTKEAVVSIQIGKRAREVRK